MHLKHGYDVTHLGRKNFSKPQEFKQYILILKLDFELKLKMKVAQLELPQLFGGILQLS